MSEKTESARVNGDNKPRYRFHVVRAMQELSLAMFNTRYVTDDHERFGATREDMDKTVPDWLSSLSKYELLTIIH